MTVLVVWGLPIEDAALGPGDAEYLSSLPQALPPVEWLWGEMDRVWDDLRLDNSHPLGEQPIDVFYRHPVWVANGIFSLADPTSAGHRRSIAAHLASSQVKRIADYGGGFGALAETIARAIPAARITIVDPFPSAIGMSRVAHIPGISYVAALEQGEHDAVIAQDVLEHLEDPIGTAASICHAVKPGGLVVFANNFEPVIKCHLPATFHLRHTFNQVMARMGMSFVGSVEGATHAKVFRRRGDLSLASARAAERASRIIGPWMNTAGRRVAAAKRLILGRGSAPR